MKWGRAEMRLGQSREREAARSEMLGRRGEEKIEVQLEDPGWREASAGRGFGLRGWGLGFRI